jgi:tetratricopeptide (TPR) repeat protein
LRALIERQLEQLSPAAQRVLEAASVVGLTGSAAAVAAGVERGVEEVEEHCAGLARRGQFLQASGVEAWPDGTVAGRYTFCHALYQQVVYARLPPARRRGLHQRIGARVEAGYGARAGEQAAWLAQQAFRGGVWDKAVVYSRQAGAKAMARSAPHEAVACVKQALAALTHLPESRTAQEQAIDLRVDLRDVLWQLGDIRQMLEHCRQAAALAEALADQPRLGRVSIFMCRYLRELGDHAGAVEAGQHALAVAATLGDGALQVSASFHLGIAAHFLGDQRQALAWLRRRVEWFAGERLQERSSPMFGYPAVVTRAWCVRCLAELGAFPEARAQAAEAVRLAEAVEHPFSLAHAYLGVGCLALRQGALSQAIAALERSLECCRVADSVPRFPETAAALGCAYASAGRVAEALPLLEQAEQQGAARGSMGGQALRVGYWSEASLRAGRMPEARQRAGRALALARTHQERGHEAWVLRLLGEIAAHQAPLEVEPAAAHYRQALALAEALGMRPLQAHCHRGLGTLYVKTGQREQARTELSTAIELYQSMEMSFWLPETEAALAQVEGR